MKKLFLTVVILLIAFPADLFAKENLFYYFENHYGFDSFKKNASEIDILAPQVYEVGYDLKVKKLTSKGKKILSEAKKKKADVMPLIVNDDFSKILMSDILLSSTAQDEIIDFMIKEAKARKFIGWQFDFENINHLDRGMYVDFVKKTYQKSKAENLQFSVAVIVRSNDYDPTSTNQDWSSAYDYKRLAANSDYLTLMTYDDPRSVGPVASLPYVERILNYMITQAPAEKMSLGVPFYCWQWQDGVRTNSTTYNLAIKAYNKASKKTREKEFDENLGAEYIKFVRDGVTNEIWCDTAKSIEIKDGIIDDYGLRGFSAWALGQEDKNIWKYLKSK